VFFRYFLVGGVAALFDFCFFLLFATWLGFNYLLIGGVGFVFATLINYILSVRLVFRSGARFDRQGEIIAVYLVSGAGLALHELVLYISVSGLMIEGFVGKVIATGSVFVWNYGWRKLYVFREN